MKVITVLGTRPEIIKLSPVIDLLEKDSFFNHKIIHTGQHYDFNMDKIFFEELNLPEPSYALNIGSLPREEQLRAMQDKIETILKEERPDLVIVQGDTNSTLGGARAAKKCGIKLMHIEAGCRSFNKEMPEEINRIEVDQLSDHLIVPDAYALTNLENEEKLCGKLSGKIKNCGSTAYDAAQRNILFSNQVITQRLNLEENSFVLVTIHRAENTQEPNITQIVDALNKISETEKLVFPIHPRTKKVLEEKKIMLAQNITLIEPQSYLHFLALISSCKFCITDSGGVQEEAVVFNKPCLIPRNETEWMQPVDDGKNILAGTTTEKILSTYSSVFNKAGLISIIRKKHQFYVGASRNILQELKEIQVHSTAEVSLQAKLGSNVKVWHHAQIREGAIVGDNSIFGKNVYVDKNVIIGKNCKIQNNCSIYHGVTLEEGVFIGPHCVLTNDKNPRAIDRDGKLKSDSDWVEGKIVIQKGASLGARTVVLPNVTIGQFALVGAGSVVTKDVPDFGLVYGNPARLGGYVCRCGQKLEERKAAGEKCGKCQ